MSCDLNPSRNDQYALLNPYLVQLMMERPSKEDLYKQIYVIMEMAPYALFICT